MAQRYFKKEVLAEAQKIALESRLWDRPQLPGITIDGIESRDLDDAIWLQETDDGVILSVHVADVAEYVAIGSALEKTAFERTQTRYLKYGNEPMLPHILSENCLSLLEGEARPTVTVNITLNQDAIIQSVEILESWITSLRRFSYPDVDQSLQDKTSSFYPFLNACFSWADRLYQRRTDPEMLAAQPEGSWMDENGTWIRNEGTQYRSYLIIQEFMIIANSAIAQWMSKRQLMALYRNHLPNIETDLPTLFRELAQMGWDGDRHRQLQSGLNRAEYNLYPIGHFALKRLAYCHFTSPIRRLADLINHRMIKAHLHGSPAPYSAEVLTDLRNHIETVNQLQMESTKAFFKSIHQEQYEVLLKQPQSIQGLDNHEFSLLLRYGATSNQVEILEQMACQRLRDQRLSVEDWFVILFLTDNPILRSKVLYHIKRDVHHAPSIIAIARNQLEDWGDIHYRVIGQSPFTAWLEIEIEGSIWTTEDGTSHIRKQSAKHGACLTWLKAFCDHQLIPTGIEQEPEETEEEPPSDIAVLQTVDNAVSQLNELCQKYQWDRPEYRFQEEEEAGFMCECELLIKATSVQGFGSGLRKAIAKQLAAQQILEQLSKLNSMP